MTAPSCLLVLAVLALAAPLAGAQAKAKEPDPTIPVRLKKTVTRTWQQVQADKYAYGPRQEVDNETNETHVWLPYGRNTALYHEVQGQLTDPGEVANNGRSTVINPQDAGTTCLIAWKVAFDKPITSFRFEAGWQELNLGERSAAGVEYSFDGKKWKTLQEVKGTDPGMAGGMKMGGAFGKGVRVADISTQLLFLRVYARDAKDPEARHGDTRWLRLILAGDPAWGDAERTFFASQPQLWVAAGKK